MRQVFRHCPELFRADDEARARMEFISRLSTSAQRRVYRALLCRAIGRYLEGDLALEQLDVHLRAGTIDLRGLTNLIQLAGACRMAKAVVSVDAGPMHVAAGVGTPTLAIVGNDAQAVGASPIRLWQPRTSNLTRTVSSKTCSLCSENRFRNDGCIAEAHDCMEGVDAQQVITWLEATLA